jgi:hypothetical protein
MPERPLLVKGLKRAMGDPPQVDKRGERRTPQGRKASRGVRSAGEP